MEILLHSKIHCSLVLRKRRSTYDNGRIAMPNNIGPVEGKRKRSREFVRQKRNDQILKLNVKQIKQNELFSEFFFSPFRLRNFEQYELSFRVYIISVMSPGPFLHHFAMQTIRTDKTIHFSLGCTYFFFGCFLSTFPTLRLQWSDRPVDSLQ